MADPRVPRSSSAVQVDESDQTDRHGSRERNAGGRRTAGTGTQQSEGGKEREGRRDGLRRIAEAGGMGNGMTRTRMARKEGKIVFVNFGGR